MPGPRDPPQRSEGGEDHRMVGPLRAYASGEKLAKDLANETPVTWLPNLAPTVLTVCFWSLFKRV